jgi:hypothetical protein
MKQKLVLWKNKQDWQTPDKSVDGSTYANH